MENRTKEGESPSDVESRNANIALAAHLHGSEEVRAALGTTALWHVVARVARAWCAEQEQKKLVRA